MRFRAQFATAALSMALVGGLTAAATTTAQARPTDSTATSAAAAKYYLKFDKSTVTNSRLYLMKSVSGPDKVIKKYKAGSGVSTNTCASLKGWLPNGDYKIRFHQKNYPGSKIHGYVIRISDKKCHNGTKRDELFIHSEMTRNGGQGRAESERWTNSNPNDYYSNGCIKLNPANIKNLFAKVDSLGWSKLAKLKVVS